MPNYLPPIESFVFGVTAVWPGTQQEAHRPKPRRDEVPRVEFNTEAELKDWWEGMTKPSKYVVYTTETSEIILEPKTSTSPVRFGYYRAMTSDAFQRVIGQLKEAGYRVFACKNYEWKSDMIMSVRR